MYSYVPMLYLFMKHLFINKCFIGIKGKESDAFAFGIMAL